MALLENERIRLRALEPEDLELLYRLENDTQLWSTGDSIIPYSRYTLKNYIAEAHRSIYEICQLRLAIELKDSPGAIGMIDLYDFDPHHRKAGTGVVIEPAYQRQGIAMEAVHLLSEYAFSFLKLHQLYAYISIRNTASLILFERCGFVNTGTLTDWICTSEGFMDVLMMQRINYPAGK